MKYTIHCAKTQPLLNLKWDDPSWQNAEVLTISNFLSRSSDHRPVTEAKVLYDNDALYVSFRVQDRYVRAVATKYLDPVCRDSCAEFFVEPVKGKGYFNFEVNCGGTLLLFYIEDPTRTPGGPTEFKKMTAVSADIAQTIEIKHSMPQIVDPEIPDSTIWMIQYRIPKKVFEAYVGPQGALPGQSWRGNFYKCGDKTSHPHWATWAPIDEVNFHLPRCFAPLHLVP